MNTKKYLIILLAIIGAGAIYYFTQSKSTIEDEFDIALEDVELVDEISIIKEGGEVELRRIDRQWTLKDFNQVSQARVQNLLSFLETLAVSSPITGPKGQEGISEAIGEGIHISCSSEGKEMFELFLIQNPKGLKGNFAYKPNHKYLVQLVGSVDLSEMISGESSFWQSKSIFSVQASIIKKIELDWQDEMKNFTISSNTKGGFYFYRDKSNETANADENKLKYYSYEFANVHMDIKNEKYKQLAGKLLCSVELMDTNARKSGASFYQLLNNNNEVDKNHLVVHILNTEVWGKVSYVKMSPILKQADFFLSK
ncbi:hypothetical protein [Labilibacter marinus]|uniref:hypothetical protein n=1 Tax=Labilibacter marinus TaxID=1477105 RepID=UPI0008317270|nr:hypothetical protein [Labilibacter marinus]